LAYGHVSPESFYIREFIAIPGKQEAHIAGGYVQWNHSWLVLVAPEHPSPRNWRSTVGQQLMLSSRKQTKGRQ
jgi:hypothetical protein